MLIGLYFFPDTFTTKLFFPKYIIVKSCPLINPIPNVVGLGAINETSAIYRPKAGDINSSNVFFKPGKRCMTH